MAEQGEGQRAIAPKLIIYPVGRCNITEKFKETGSCKDRPRKGPMRVTTEREDREMGRRCSGDRRISAISIAAEVNATCQKPISVPTVRRRLCERGLHGRRPRKVPLLSEANIRTRYQWTKKRQHWTSADWSQIIWSDESNIEINQL